MKISLRLTFLYIIALASLSLTFSESVSAAITISSASWSSGRLSMAGTSTGRQTVTISNAVTGQSIGRVTASRSGSWSYSTSLSSSRVPCTARATTSADGSTDSPVSGAPSTCQGAAKADQAALTVSANPMTITSGGAGSTLSSSGGSGTGNVTYAITSGPCSLTGSTLTGTAPGSCSVTATKAADTSYNAITSAPVTVTVTKAEQAALTVSANPMTITSGGAGSTLSTSGGSTNGTVTYAANTASGTVSCNISGNTLTAMGGAGSCSVTATMAGNTTYNAVSSAAITVNVTKQTQAALTVSANPMTITSGGTSSTLSTSGGSTNGTVTYAANTASGTVSCNISGNTLTATGGAGSCSVTATKAADTNYNAITSAAIVVTVKAQTNTTPISINSTSTDSLAPVEGSVSELPSSPVGINGTHSILAVNDLGMHCVDNDTRVVNILPPFQVLLGQVVQKGSKPVLNPTGVELFYSATSNAKDPILGKTNVLNGLRTDGTTFKTNFWWNVDHGGYDAFYPAGLTLSTSGLMAPDKGLPVPNTEKLYLEGQPLEISQQLSPGVAGAYSANDAQKVNEHYTNKPFFKDFPFGYVADKVNWHEAAGIPMAPFDDSGRQNPYPLIRVQAKPSGSTTALASVDTVLPVSSESSCVNCHASTQDVAESGAGRRTLIPVTELINAGLPVASSANDPDPTLPASVKLEYGTDINILRLHDLKHGKDYVKATGTGATDHVAAECDIVNNKPNGNDNCLTYQALVTEKPVVCQTCHYTPALDLLQVGPKNENGRIQLVNKTNSNVMHSHHGSLKDESGNPLFPLIPQAQQATDGSITNQPARAAALEENCYQCHPGKDTKCLRGAMFNGGMLCSDCHGDMTQVGNDFSRDVSKAKPAAFDLHGNFYTDASQPRVPWANEPGCGSCHTGDANSNFATKSGVLKNLKDHNGVNDNIRLRQAFLTGDPKATPIVPTNKRFAEPVVPAKSATGLTNPGAGNPQLFRVSTGHSGVMCEGCHGPTHAEWPVADNNANDNQTAIQLQGHAGFISECTACHTSGSLSASTQNGPHGMHVVNDSRFWSEAHKDMAKSENRKAGGGTCGSCHGSDHLGTVLSRVPVDRTFRVEGTNRTVKAGQPVACNLCHSVSKSFGN